jgi:RNA polymerase sigma-70 factor (ECF subfamily)
MIRGSLPLDVDDGGRHRARRPPDQDRLSVALVGALAGDEQAFVILYRGVQPGLVRYLRTVVGPEADDVASETWLQVCRDLSTFRGDIEGFRGWCATVARHRAMDHLRRQRVRPQTTNGDWLTAVADLADTWVSASDAISTDRALALISSLPRAQAEAVLLRVVMGLDVATAARVLGKRPGSVRTATYRGLRQLADLMEQRGV